MSRVVVAILLFASTLFAQNVDTELLRHFDYDQKAPLDVQEAGVEPRGDSHHPRHYLCQPEGRRSLSERVAPGKNTDQQEPIICHLRFLGSALLPLQQNARATR